MSGNVSYESIIQIKMKTIKSTLLLVCLSILSTCFVSCKKSQVGPAGPQGTTGEQGLTGAQGNANVKSFVFSTSNWKGDSACKNFSYEYHLTDLNNSVLENGAVILYLGDDTGDNKNKWTPMPLSNNNLRYTFDIELSAVHIFISRVDGSMPQNPGTQKFKLVLIPPAS